jgi:hypothetical protein
MTMLVTTAREVLSPSQRQTTLDIQTSERPTTLDVAAPIRVASITKEIEVKIASTRDEWEQAFGLVAANYRARGYEPASTKRLRLTPYHALSDTTTFVAKHEGSVVTTFSLVADNTLLGLPMESIYGPEIAAARQQGRKMAEVTSLADAGLSVREFLQVFTALIRLMKQFHVSRGGDTWVIAVNPRHRNFYCKVLGYQTLGPCKPYAVVSDAPAEAYWLDRDMMRAGAPKMFDDIFGRPVPPAALVRRPIPADLLRRFAEDSTQTDARQVQEILDYERHYGSPRRWEDAGGVANRQRVAVGHRPGVAQEAGRV